MPSMPPRATRRARASSRRVPAPARPGCWSRACCARCSTARRRTRSWRSPSRVPRPARCASASTSGSPTSPRLARPTTSACVRSSTWRRCGAGGGARARAGHAAGPRARGRESGRDPHLPRLVRAAAAIGAARAARPPRRPGQRRARRGSGASTDRPCTAPSTPLLLRDDALRADHAAATAARGRHQLRVWLDTVWDRRVEFELADEAGVLATSVERAEDVWPELAAYAPSRRGDRDRRVDRSASNGSARARRGARQAGAGCGRRTCRRALPRAAGSASPPSGRRCSRRPTSRARSPAACRSSSRCRTRSSTWPIRSTSTNPAKSTCAWFASAGRCSPRSPTTSECKASPTWPTSSASRSSCCATASCRAGSRSGSTRASRHLLIDEFQDTSPLQWHALHGWLSGYAGAGGGASGQRPPGVFIVGDPKQSIYRFRRAEPRVFEAAARFVREGLDGSVLACDHTRRNAPPVIEAINSVFAAAGELFPGFRRHTTEVGAARRAGCRRCLASSVRLVRRRAAATTRRPWSGATASPRRDWSSTRCCASARPRRSPRP